MKKFIGAFLSVFMLFSLTSCGSSASSSNNFSIKADGLNIEPGKSKLQDILDQGYTYQWSQLYKPTDKIDGKTFITTAIEIMKDGQRYASVGLINKSSTSSKVEDCIVGDTRIYAAYEGQHKYSELIVNGENIVGLTLDDIKSKMKEKPNTEDEKRVLYYFDKNSYEVEFDDQKIVKTIKFDVSEN
ncbi:MAG: hypothetical protein AB6733_07975 [Clostridiaceae bacterium]